MDLETYEDIIKKRRRQLQASKQIHGPQHPITEHAPQPVVLLRDDVQPRPWPAHSPPWGNGPITIDDHNAMYSTKSELKRHRDTLKDWYTNLNSRRNQYHSTLPGQGSFNTEYNNRLAEIRDDYVLRSQQVQLSEVPYNKPHLIPMYNEATKLALKQDPTASHPDPSKMNKFELIQYLSQDLGINPLDFDKFYALSKK